MHYASIEVIGKDCLIIILSSTSIHIRFLYPFSRVDIMVGFHLLGNPYFPNEGNAGWIEDKPEDEHPIPLDDHHVEGFYDGSDSEPEVNNLPPVAPVPNPNPCKAF